MKGRISTKGMSGRKRNLQTEAHTAKMNHKSICFLKLEELALSGLHPLLSMCLKYTNM